MKRIDIIGGSHMAINTVGRTLAKTYRNELITAQAIEAGHKVAFVSQSEVKEVFKIKASPLVEEYLSAPTLGSPNRRQRRKQERENKKRK